MSDSTDFYNKYWNSRKNSGGRYRYSIFKSWVPMASKVLDIGSGDGYFADLITREKKAQVTCLDISSVALERAKAKGLNTVVADLEKGLPFDNDSFDCVVASEIIEHVAFSEELLSEMKRVAPVLLISVPNSAFWKYRLQLLVGSFPRQWAFHPREHLRFWSIGDFKKMCDSLGLKVKILKAGSGRKYLRDIWPSLFAEQVCFKLTSK